jgi:hypothetical protein
MDDDLTQLGNDLLEIVDRLYKATEAALALLARVRDMEAAQGHTGASVTVLRP